MYYLELNQQPVRTCIYGINCSTTIVLTLSSRSQNLGNVAHSLTGPCGLSQTLCVIKHMYCWYK
jgi:hypothetical protein